MPKKPKSNQKLLNFGVTRPRPLQLRDEPYNEDRFEPINLATPVMNQNELHNLSKDENCAPPTPTQNSKQERFVKWFLSQKRNCMINKGVITPQASDVDSSSRSENSQKPKAVKEFKTTESTHSGRKGLKMNIKNLSVAIMYDKSYLTMKQAHSIKEEILKSITDDEGDTDRPQFFRFFYDDGGLKLTCANKFSKTWLRQYLESSHSLETNRPLILLEEKDFVPLIKAKLFLRDDRIESTEYEIKSRLQKYNKKYDIDSWFIYNIRVQESKRFMLKGLHLILGLTTEQVEIVTQNDCRVTYGIATGLLKFYGSNGLQKDPPDVGLAGNHASVSNETDCQDT